MLAFIFCTWFYIEKFYESKLTRNLDMIFHKVGVHFTQTIAPQDSFWRNHSDLIILLFP